MLPCMWSKTMKREQKKKGFRQAVLLLMGVFVLSALAGCGKKPAEAQEVTKAEGTLRIGEEITLYIEDTQYMSQVKPPSPMGYYDYYPEEEGWRYLVVSGTTENRSGEDFNPKRCYVEGYVDGEPREGKLLILAAPGTEFWDTLPADSKKGSWDFYLFTLTREEEEPEELGFFYNDGFTEAKEGEKWDHKITLELFE